MFPRYKRSFAAILWLQRYLIIFPILNIFYFLISNFPSTLYVQCQVWHCTYFLNVVLSRYLLRCFSNIFETGPVNPTITRIYYFQTSYKLQSYCKVFTFQNFSASFLEHISLDISMSMYKRLTFSLHRT
jgi:hypothetical protein